MYPGQQKFSQFDPVTSTQSGDKIPILRGGQNKIITVDNFSGVAPSYWYAASETWTYSAYNSTTRIFVATIPSGDIKRYPNDARIWFKQSSSNIYGIVVSSTTTSITMYILGGSTPTNTTISSPFISPVLTPITDDNIDFIIPTMAGSIVWPLEAVNSGTWTDLPTVGPSATVIVRSSRSVTISLYCNFGGGVSSYQGMGFAVSGATTISPSDDLGIFGVGQQGRWGATFPVLNLNPGVNVFTAKYKTGANMAFSDRRITVQTLD